MSGVEIHGTGDQPDPSRQGGDQARWRRPAATADRQRAAGEKARLDEERMLTQNAARYGRSKAQRDRRQADEENSLVNRRMRADEQRWRATLNDAHRENSERDRVLRYRQQSERKASKFTSDYWDTVWIDAHQENRLRGRADSYRAKAEVQADRAERVEYGTSVRDAYREKAERDAAGKARQRAEAVAMGAAMGAAAAENANLDRQNPEFYKISDIRRYGQRGARAARDRDYTELALVERELFKLDKHLDQRAEAEPENAGWIARQRDALKQSQAQVAASKGDNMMPGAGIMGAIGAFKEGPWGIALKAALDTAVAVATAPQTIAKLMDGLMSGAKPYMNLHMGAMDVGRAGGFRGQDLEDALYPGTSIPTWMSRRGLTPESAMSILNTYGIAPGSVDSARGVISSIADAQYMPSLGGLGFDRYAKAANFAQTLGVTGMDRTAGMSYGFGASPYGPADVDHRSGVITSYWRDMQRTMTAAVGAGMDRSQVWNQIDGLMSHVASTGAGVDATKAMDFWWRMASSGASNARTGEAQMSALQGMQSAIGSAGLGGGNAQNAALFGYFARHGGMPKSAGSWAKTLGIDPTSLSPALRKQFGLLVEASRENGQVVATEYLKRFLDADPALWQRIVSGSGMVPRGALGPLVAGAISGFSTDGQIDYDVGAAARPWSGKLGGPQTWSDLSDGQAKQIREIANAKGVDPAWVTAVMAQESGGRQYGPDGKTLRSSAGALGRMQVMPGTAAQYGMDPNDPAQNTAAGTMYLRDMMAKYGITGGLMAYNEGPGAYEHYLKRVASGQALTKGDQQASKYASQVEARYMGFSNDPAKMKELLSTRGGLDMTASKQDYQFAAVMGDAGPVLVKFTGEIDLGTQALRKFIDGVLNATSALGKTTNQPRKPLLAGRANNPADIMHGRMPA